MIQSNLRYQEVIGEQLIESINKLQKIALGEGPAACQICGRELREGDDLTAYAFRAAGNPIFEIGYVMCGDDEHTHPTKFMRGVHELVVTGRIGLCTDASTQSSWLVLLAPEPIVASRPRTSDAYTIGENTTRETDTSEKRPTPLFEGIHERGSTQLEGTTEHTADYSQIDGTHQTEHNEQTHHSATNQGGDE